MTLRACSKPRIGFTLMEIILVLAILALVAAIAVPSFRAWLEGYRLQEGVDIVRTHFVKARTVAMEEGRPYRFHYELGTGQYRLAPDEVEYWPELAGAMSGPSISGAGYPGGLMVEDVLPPGVQFISPVEEPLGALLFWTDGTVKIYGPDGGERHELIFGLMDRQGTTRFLQVRALTGGASVVFPGGP